MIQTKTVRGKTSPKSAYWDTQSPWQRRIAACVQGPKGPMVSASLTWPAHLVVGNAPPMKRRLFPSISGSLGELDLSSHDELPKGKHKKKGRVREALQYHLIFIISSSLQYIEKNWVWMSLFSDIKYTSGFFPKSQQKIFKKKNMIIQWSTEALGMYAHLANHRCTVWHSES